MEKSILLVEDNRDDEALALRAFKKADITQEIFVVRDGPEALDFLFRRNKFKDRSPSDNPRFILLDLKLPKIDGIEVLRKIREDARTKHLPVIVFTSSNEARDLSASYRLGANSYIRKPVNFTEFADALKQVGKYWLNLNEPLPEMKN